MNDNWKLDVKCPIGKSKTETCAKAEGHVALVRKKNDHIDSEYVLEALNEDSVNPHGSNVSYIIFSFRRLEALTAAVARCARSSRTKAHCRGKARGDFTVRSTS